MYYTQEIIDHLKELGCKVPALLYSDATAEDDHDYFKQIMKLRKKYKLLTTTSDINDVKMFCKMIPTSYPPGNTMPTLMHQSSNYAQSQ